VDPSAAECSSFTLAKALQHALREHVQIVNLSLTGPPDFLLGKLIDRALEQGAVVVAAADESGNGPGFPAQHPGVIAAAGGPVAGLEHTVQAPSRDLLTTIPDAAFGFMSGSSFAAAQVAGLTALLLERSPRLGPTQVRAVLTAASATGVQAGASAPVDPCAALLAVSPDRGAPTCARTPRSARLHQAAVH
jgi:subtilisin family serine protease